ncbi:MAG TPA: hypothetical protein VKZ91_03180 [Woeseiaceae bacterium]|nr:hypothetical protein [Woeseiaceae bacterium]
MIEPVEASSEEIEQMAAHAREAQTIHYQLVPGPAMRIVATLHDIYCGHD